MNAPQEYPRVRPSFRAFVFVMGGITLLLLGIKHEWFLGALVAGKLHNLTYFLAWAIVGMAYSILATFLWVRWAPPSIRVRGILALLLLLALMTASSQVAARWVMRTTGVTNIRLDWDRDSQELTVNLSSTSQAVADARRLGALQAIVSVDGLWWSPSGMHPSQELLASEVEVFAVGAPDSLLHRQREQVSSYSAPINHQDLPSVRVPWKPSGMKSDWACIVTVKAALVNRKGKRVGRESTHRVATASLQGGWGHNSLKDRVQAFWTAGWDWNLQSGRPRAPFRVETPPPQSTEWVYSP